MQTHSLIAPGAALLLLAAGPALAGSSTAAEREATRQLNLQQAQQAQSANPRQTFADAAAGLPDNSPPAAAPTGKVAMNRMDAAQASAAGLLSALTNPPAKIASANVLDSSGRTIGAVQRVDVTPQGQPTKVSVALIGADEKFVVLDADAVTYDSSKNEILAQQSADQIKAASTG
ncbi:MAG TPA: hypothetical protein VGC16_06130 [Rhizomicrobium sp.]